MRHLDNSVLNAEIVISSLLAECPSFAKLADIEEGAYSILGEFAIYLRDGITKNALQADDLENAFSFLNKMGASDDLEVQNQRVVGVLEILDTSKNYEFHASRKRKWLILLIRQLQNVDY
ncbi:MAG: hypothetical protein GKR94_27435 [Gammaproteobacteria bacterium]|nr:hypothetical protein [Gammaproteobacteria bacterium]